MWDEYMKWNKLWLRNFKLNSVNIWINVNMQWNIKITTHNCWSPWVRLSHLYLIILTMTRILEFVSDATSLFPSLEIWIKVLWRRPRSPTMDFLCFFLFCGGIPEGHKPFVLLPCIRYKSRQTRVILLEQGLMVISIT